jgi:hypothetical protein
LGKSISGDLRVLGEYQIPTYFGGENTGEVNKASVKTGLSLSPSPPPLPPLTIAECVVRRAGPIQSRACRRWRSSEAEERV